jgi:hypothetical protein
VSEGCDQLVAAPDESLLLILLLYYWAAFLRARYSNQVVQGHKGVNSLEQVSVLKLIDVVQDNLDLLAKRRVYV